MCHCCGSDEEEGKESRREPAMLPCKYCGTLFAQTASFCPNCGARRTA